MTSLTTIRHVPIALGTRFALMDDLSQREASGGDTAVTEWYLAHIRSLGGTPPSP